MRKTVTSAIAAAALALSVSACDGTSGNVDNDPPSGSNASNNDDSSDSSNEVEPAAEEEVTELPLDENPQLGQAYTWDNGLTVTVSAAEQFQPSQYAYTEGEGTPVKFTVTVVNNTGSNYEPVMDYITVQSGNSEAGSIFDSESLGDTPSTVLLDGRETVYTVGYQVADVNDLVLEFQPGDWSLDSVVFVS